MDIKLNKIEDVEIAGIDTRDYPDFVDAFIEAASYEGRELTDEELEWVNEQSDFVYESVINYMY